MAVPSRTAVGLAGSHRCLGHLPPRDTGEPEARWGRYCDLPPAAGGAPRDQHVLAPDIREDTGWMRVVDAQTEVRVRAEQSTSRMSSTPILPIVPIMPIVPIVPIAAIVIKYERSTYVAKIAKAVVQWQPTFPR